MRVITIKLTLKEDKLKFSFEIEQDIQRVQVLRTRNKLYLLANFL